jgi:putative ABC transport system permease protein
MESAAFRYFYGLTDNEMAEVFPKGMILDIALGLDELDERIPLRVTMACFADFQTNPTTIFTVGGSMVKLLMYGGFLQEQLGENLRLMHLNINVESGRDEDVFNALYTILDNKQQMESRYELRKRLAEERQTTMVLGTGLSAILGMIGIFNFINVISVGLLVRKREFATLESVGMSKRQTRLMLRWEGAIYWIITITVSLTIGNAIAYNLYLLANSGGYFAGFAYPFFPVAIAYGLIIIVCSVTPEVAYRSLSQLSLVERLREAE